MTRPRTQLAASARHDSVFAFPSLVSFLESITLPDLNSGGRG